MDFTAKTNYRRYCGRSVRSPLGKSIQGGAIVMKIRRRIAWHHLSAMFLGLALVVMLIVLWFTTATKQPFIGNPLTLPASKHLGERQEAEAIDSDRADELLVLVGFSGGGTRAAALAYGVLEELADTSITTGIGERRLLDEIDVISSVSGGSFTNAYFALFGDRIFDDFREAMLLRPIESDLLKRLFNPGNWRDLSSPYFGASDLAVAYYDEHIFKGKTFSDIDRSSSPWAIINASDIGTGERMVFTEQVFQLLCLDYDSYPIARAVAASSGVPGATTPVAVKNHAGSCGYARPDWLRKPIATEKSPMLAARIKSSLDYLDADKRPWLHLVDGGVTDNLGLREFYEFTNLDLDDDLERMFKKYTGGKLGAVREVLIISVNAAVEHRWDWGRQPNAPTEREVLGAMTHIEMRNFTADTLHIVQQSFRDWQQKAISVGAPVSFDFVEVAFSKVGDDEERAYLNTLPTSLQLDEEQVDKLIEVGRRLLRDSPSFQQFLTRHPSEAHRGR
jgi:NTE family protein